MIRFLVRKVVDALLVCVAVSVATFALIHWTGDLAISIGGTEASREEVERIRRFYGLERSLIEQYFDWAGRVIRGDFGNSFFSREAVLAMVTARLPVTAVLAASALTFALLLAVPLGVAAATRPGSWLDRACLTVAVIGQAMPSYWSALLLIL